MKRALQRAAPFACLTLGMCATLPAANCANAERARTIALVALQAIDRVCPIN